MKNAPKRLKDVERVTSLKRVWKLPLHVGKSYHPSHPVSIWSYHIDIACITKKVEKMHNFIIFRSYKVVYWNDAQRATHGVLFA